MFCSKCNAAISPKEKFCRSCGAPVETKEPEKEVNPEEILMKAYIGKHADKIMSHKFSWPAFFFNTLYYLYRKMWLLALIWVFGSALISGLLYTLMGVFSSIVLFILHIVLASQFNKLYTKKVKEKVQHIVATNPGASTHELSAICIKKGGIAVWPVVVYVIITFITIVLVTFIILLPIIGTYIDLTDSNNGYVNDHNSTTEPNQNSGTESTAGSTLNYTVPAGFTSVTETSSYVSYMYYSPDLTNSCTFTLSIHDNFGYDSGRDYLENVAYFNASDTILHNFEDVTLGGETWTEFAVQSAYSTSYYYAIVYSGSIYYVDYTILTDSGTCSSALTSLTNSFEFVNSSNDSI